jgi:hypothetical protein
MARGRVPCALTTHLCKPYKTGSQSSRSLVCTHLHVRDLGVDLVSPSVDAATTPGSAIALRAPFAATKGGRIGWCSVRVGEIAPLSRPRPGNRAGFFGVY